MLILSNKGTQSSTTDITSNLQAATGWSTGLKAELKETGLVTSIGARSSPFLLVLASSTITRSILLQLGTFLPSLAKTGRKCAFALSLLLAAPPEQNGVSYLAFFSSLAVVGGLAGLICWKLGSAFAKTGHTTKPTGGCWPMPLDADTLASEPTKLALAKQPPTLAQHFRIRETLLEKLEQVMRIQSHLHEQARETAQRKFDMLSMADQQVATKLTRRLFIGFQERSLSHLSNNVREYYFSAFSAARLRECCVADEAAVRHNLSVDILSFSGGTGASVSSAAQAAQLSENLSFGGSLSMQLVFFFLFSTPLLLSYYLPCQYATMCNWQERSLLRLEGFLNRWKSKRTV